jgi:opacity protein-like surface antigen
VQCGSAITALWQIELLCFQHIWGRFMNKMIMGVSALLGLIAAPALAADLAPRTYTKAPPAAPVAAVYDWTGGYVGIEGGYGWGHSDQTDPGIAPPPAAAATTASTASLHQIIPSDPSEMDTFQ